MSTRISRALNDLEEARVFHGEDVRYREELRELGKLDKGKKLDILTDIHKQQARVRRAVAIIRYERNHG